LVFEILWEFAVNAAEKCFENDVQQFGCLVVEIGEALFDEGLQFGEIVAGEVFSFFSFLFVARVLVGPGDFPEKIN
jgi:hypothetical protein